MTDEQIKEIEQLTFETLMQIQRQKQARINLEMREWNNGPA